MAPHWIPAKKAAVMTVTGLVACPCAFREVTLGSPDSQESFLTNTKGAVLGTPVSPAR